MLHLLQLRRHLTPLLLIALSIALVGTTGCNRSKPRSHWWEFWKPKRANPEVVEHMPDKQILPPPPDVMDPEGRGQSAGLSPDSDLLPPPPSMEEASAMPEPDALRQEAQATSELRNVNFAYDSSELSADARAILDQNAQWLMNRPSYDVSIEGHTDERGTAEYNLNLGARRAKSVRDYLISRGVDASRLHTISYGEERPINPNSTEESFAQNRRVQFLVY